MDKKKLIAAIVALVLAGVAAVTQIDFKSSICGNPDAQTSQK